MPTDDPWSAVATDPWGNADQEPFPQFNPPDPWAQHPSAPLHPGADDEPCLKCGHGGTRHDVVDRTCYALTGSSWEIQGQCDCDGWEVSEKHRHHFDRYSAEEIGEPRGADDLLRCECGRERRVPHDPRAWV